MNKYFIKSFLLNSYLIEECRKINRVLFIHYNSKFIKDLAIRTKLFLSLSEKDYSIEKALEISDYYFEKYPHLWKECLKICHAHVNRVNRLKKRIESMLLDKCTGELKPCIFLTLTFNNNILSTTSNITRRRYINRFLNSLNCPYVGNIDFGDNHFYIDKNGNERISTSREHYHALIQTDNIDYSLYSYGIINGQKVRHTSAGLTKLAKYVAKLTNHAIKESTKRSVIIYSRKYK